jgi:hypothetical protein
MFLTIFAYRVTARRTRTSFIVGRLKLMKSLRICGVIFMRFWSADFNRTRLFWYCSICTCQFVQFVSCALCSDFIAVIQLDFKLWSHGSIIFQLNFVYFSLCSIHYLGSIHFLAGGGGPEELMSNSMLKLGTPKRKVDKKLWPPIF